ncbi:MAG: polysaccharide biosynthesis tyrosine autokinase [Pirellulaceae bacterium]|nr:polysaccharide biosynthesis tyrosine autokinase [Pirellulaceae bacterium]
MSDNGPHPVDPQMPSENRALPAITQEPVGAIGNPMPVAPWMETKESNDGFNFSGFLHSLRRRWLAGVGFGCIAATIVATLLYLLVPVKFEAFVTLRVRRNPDEILRQNRRTNVHPADFEIEKQTQAALLKSPFVINAALRDPTINQMPLVRDEAWPFGKRKKPEAWLAKQLKVEYSEGSEILVLSMHEKNENEQLVKLLNAVTRAYMEEIVDAEAAERMIKLQKLRDRYRDLMDDMNASLKKISELAKTYGSTESESVKLQIDLGLRQLAALDRERMSADQQYFEAYDMMMLQQQRINAQMSYDPRPFEIEDVLQSQYPDYAMLKTQKIELEHMMKSRSGGRASPAGAMQPQLAAIQSQLDQIRYEKKDEVTERLRMMSGNDSRILQEDLSVLQLKVRSLLQRRNKTYSEYEKLSNQLKSMGAYNSELDGEKLSLQAQQEFVSDVKKEMETLELEVASKPQIRVLQEAVIPDENNLLSKYFQVIAASILTMFVTVLGVAFWDMQSKRVNSSQELSASGDLRVIGSLPQINARRAAGLLPMTESNKQRVEIGLTRAIDSIRTALSFAKTSRPYQILMVTSALGQEGKTTVASQLAVSFARSGKRTLLIDADVRNPQQHVVLGMPFQRGLCDLLRSEATVEELIQPTPAEGLWLLGAGTRDAGTDQLMACSFPTIIEDLRSQFEMIIIDTGPALTCPDAMLIGQTADAALISIMRDVSRTPKVTDACHRLQSVGITIAGAVLNGDTMDIRASDLQMTNDMSHDPQLEKSNAS